MQQKNYYKILQVSPNCTSDEIKKAYRKLALQFHPDINPKTITIFSEIKEAYEILADEKSRKKFHHFYLYHQVTDKTVSIDSLVHKTYLLTKFIQNGNQFTMDYEMVVVYIKHLLQPLHIELIANSNQSSKQLQVEANIFIVSQILPFSQYQKIYSLIVSTFPSKANLYIEMYNKKKRTMLWDKYASWLAIIIAVLICFFIAYVA